MSRLRTAPFILILFTAPATALADGAFTPVSEMPGIVQPPPGVVPINAPRVILGLAQRYVVNAPNPFSGFPHHAELTADFVTYEPLPAPPGSVYSMAAFAAQDGWPVLGRAMYYTPGQAFPQAPTVSRVCFWDSDGSVTTLSTPTPTFQIPYGISDDGAHALLQSGLSQAKRSFYAEGTSAQNIEPAPGEDPQLDTQVFGLSPDGQTAVGTYNESRWDFFTWTPAGGAVTHSSPFGMIPRPAMVSNGGVRVMLRPTAEPFTEAITNATFSRGVWRRTPGFAALSMTADGRAVVGAVRSESGAFAARLWTETLGVRPLADELTARGLDLRGWTLTHADHITPDGRTIVGRGAAPGSAETRWWVALLPAPIAAADIAGPAAQEGGDGKLDNNDWILYINRFFQQDERADVGGQGAEPTPDGAFDNNDFCVFINQFFTAAP